MTATFLEKYLKTKKEDNYELIIASNNRCKIEETKEILRNFKIIPMEKILTKVEIEEDENTFEKNAIKKAKTIAKILRGRLCIADDSGIEIEYLNGFPGVYTKRWHSGNDREKNLAIIEKLKGVPKEKRKIKFITAIAISNGEDVMTSIASIEGYVSEDIRGQNGFGFDEIFELDNGKTLAELSFEEKNEISARKKALQMLNDKIIEEN